MEASVSGLESGCCLRVSSSRLRVMTEETARPRNLTRMDSRSSVIAASCGWLLQWPVSTRLTRMPALDSHAGRCSSGAEPLLQPRRPARPQSRGPRKPPPLAAAAMTSRGHVGRGRRIRPGEAALLAANCLSLLPRLFLLPPSLSFSRRPFRSVIACLHRLSSPLLAPSLTSTLVAPSLLPFAYPSRHNRGDTGRRARVPVRQRAARPLSAAPGESAERRMSGGRASRGLRTDVVHASSQGRRRAERRRSPLCPSDPRLALGIRAGHTGRAYGPVVWPYARAYGPVRLQPQRVKRRGGWGCSQAGGEGRSEDACAGCGEEWAEARRGQEQGTGRSARTGEDRKEAAGRRPQERGPEARASDVRRGPRLRPVRSLGPFCLVYPCLSRPGQGPGQEACTGGRASPAAGCSPRLLR